MFLEKSYSVIEKPAWNDRHLRLRLHLLHDSQEVASPDEAQIGLAVALSQEAAGEVDEFGRGCKTRHTAVAIEVRSDADVLDTHDVNGMVDMGNGIEDGGLPVGAEEAVVESDLRHTACLGQCPQLVVGEVARMVAKYTAAGVGADDGLSAQFQGVVETALTGMRKVHHDAEAVHLADDLCPEVRNAQRRLAFARSCRAADVVVAIVAECHIDDALFGKML